MMKLRGLGTAELCRSHKEVGVTGQYFTLLRQSIFYASIPIQLSRRN